MELIVASVIAFATTNIDDIFILTLFFAHPRFSAKSIIAGQYLGIGTLIAISFAGSFIGLIIDMKYVGLLGFVPVYIGVKSVVALMQDKGENENIQPLDSDGKLLQKILYVAGITIANGGDNISIYIPLLATLSLSGKVGMAIIFLAMTGVWCMAARYLSKHPLLKGNVERYGHIVTPFIFILLGIYIIAESKAYLIFFPEG